MSMKRILVTGGNKGIGRAICERLLTEWSDTFVYMGARSVERGQAAVEDIIKTCSIPQDRLAVVELDTSDDASVQAAADFLQKDLSDSSLYGIINNAGVGWGFSMKDTINVNYFGPRRVNDAFSGMVQPNGRIVNIASASGPNFLQSLNDNDPLKEKLHKPWLIPGGLKELDDMARGFGEGDNAYGVSKAFLNAYTVLDSKMNKSIFINSVTPGFILTDLTAGTSASNTPAMGAVPPCWLLMEADDSLPPGRYYGSDCKRSPMHYYRGPGEPVYTGDEDLVDL